MSEERGYLENEDGYLAGDYLAGEKDIFNGSQVEMIVKRAVASGMQSEMIVGALKETGVQSEMIVSALNETGMQAEMGLAESFRTGFQVDQEISALYDTGFQATMNPVDFLMQGMQAEMQINDSLRSHAMQVRQEIENAGFLGMQAKQDKLRHWLHEVYLVEGYLTGPYLASKMCAFLHMQVNMITRFEKETGMQVDMMIDAMPDSGIQTEMIVDDALQLGQQVEMIINKEIENGMQTEQVIRAESANGTQVEMIVNTQKETGMQVNRVRVMREGMQITMVIYNITQLRLMWEFPSRGTEDLLGENWTATTTQAGDFQTSNLNTDIIEQYWRSQVGGHNLTELTCDTGVPQGVPIDTIAILGHNFTTSASVQVQGSNDNFATAPNITFNMLVERDNMYYISPTFPTVAGQNRYWRFIIQDTTNPEEFLRVGTILFGTSEIFSVLECFTNPIVQGLRHFKDTVPTEGFTNKSNDRALKKFLRLNFEELNFFRGNYRILDDMMRFARTSLKVLVIPTPQRASRFATYGKLTSLPEVEFRGIDDDTEYVSLELEWDESQ